MTRAKRSSAAITETRFTDPTGAAETTRLLDNDGPEAADGGDTGSNASGWDGYKDFEGLPWWQRPSV